MATGASRIEHPTGEVTAFYRHGWHSWSHTAWVDPGRPPYPAVDRYRRLGVADPAHALDSDLGGSDVGAVDHGDGRVTLLGALDPGAWVTWDGRELAGRYESGSGEWFSATAPEDEVFAAYAGALGTRLGTNRNRLRSVWCTWYSHYEDISADRVDDLARQVEPFDFDVFQIDDGWQQAIGDWEPNSRFGDGMAARAEVIRGTGKRPGLWLAPFIAHAGSRLAAERSELLLRDPAGGPVVAGYNWDGEYYALDLTAAATADFLRGLFERVTTWGFDYLKLDFVYAGAFPGAHRREMPRHDAYRNGLALVRETVGDEVYLLGCGAPIVASLGLVDGLRIGPDVAPVWEQPEARRGDGWVDGTRGALATSLHRLWLAPAVQTDPDAVYVRSEGIDLEPATRHAMEDLARIAGFVTSSDPPDWLTADERDRLHRLLAQPRLVVPAGRHRWEVDGRSVDLRSLAAAPAVMS